MRGTGHVLKFRAKASAPRAWASRISCSQWASVIVPIYFMLDRRKLWYETIYHVMEKPGCKLALLMRKSKDVYTYTGFPVLPVVVPVVVGVVVGVVVPVVVVAGAREFVSYII
jgi:hypothetical protein